MGGAVEGAVGGVMGKLLETFSYLHSYGPVLVISLLASAVLTPICGWYARRRGIVDHPGEAKIHKHATPLLGGVAIYVAFLVAVALTRDYSNELKGVVAAGSIVFILGLMDDAKGLPASLRLFGQFVAAGILVDYGIVVKFIPNHLLAALVTAVGVVGVTNATNFLDNMDGLAAGLVAIASATFFLIGYRTDQHWLCFLAIAMCGATCGFLVHNAWPARIFMGDSGSTFIGFVMASLAVMGEWSSDAIVAATIPSIVVSIFLFDTILITVLRIKEGKVRSLRQWIEHRDTDHVSHRLVAAGSTRSGAVIIIYLAAAALGVMAWTTSVLGRPAAVASIVTILASGLAAGWWLDRVGPLGKSA